MSKKSRIKCRVAAFLALSSAGLLGACAPLAGGVGGYDNFLTDSAVVALQGPQSAVRAAQCFENQAIFLPLAEFSRDSAKDTFTYRLRVAGVWYEQVQITANGSGSRAEIRLAPGLSGQWTEGFDRDRGTVLSRCVAL